MGPKRISATVANVGPISHDTMLGTAIAVFPVGGRNDDGLFGTSRPRRGMTASGPARPIGRYLLYGEIASGGMATVHFGRLNGPAGFARTVAVKRLHPQFARDPDFL